MKTHLAVKETVDKLFSICSVVGMVLHSAVTIGEANASAPNFAKAKMAAASLMRLITTEPSIDNLSEEGETLVGDTSSLPATTTTDS